MPTRSRSHLRPPDTTPQWEEWARSLSSDTATDYTAYAANPVGFITDVLGVTLTAEQVQICESVRDRVDTNVQAAHGVGKTAVAAWLTLWWAFAVCGLVITTAPTKRQVEELLWAEIRKTHGRCNLPGECLTTKLKQGDLTLAFGFTANDHNSNAFQGIHHERLLVIEDEACGISPEIDDGAESCVTGSDNRILRIGNPVSRGNPFERACRIKHLRISPWNHPNVSWAYKLQLVGDQAWHRLKPEIAAQILNTPEAVEAGEEIVKPQHLWPPHLPRDVIKGAISVNWIEKQRAKHGEGSPFWMGRIEGIFPNVSGQSFIPYSLFMAARARYDQNKQYWDSQARIKPSTWGVDPGDGGDPHGLARWQGNVLYFVDEEPGLGDEMDTIRIAHRLKRIAQPQDTIFTDRAGIGTGTNATLKAEGLKAHGIHWAESAKNPKQFANSKAEDWWMLREALQRGDRVIAPLGAKEDEVREELTSVFYESSGKDLIKAEDKKKTKKRLGKSPNRADAVVLGSRSYSPVQAVAVEPPKRSPYVGQLDARGFL